ncbi:MAG: hypothetical protein WDN07_03635 [Actinomycetota bacterium]
MSSGYGARREHCRKNLCTFRRQRSVNSLTITTDDGSAGITGLVSDVLPALIVENEIDVIYSCGTYGNA